MKLKLSLFLILVTQTILFVRAEEMISHHSIEVQIGISNLTENAFPFDFNDESNSIDSIIPVVAYVYSFNKIIHLGAFLGFDYNILPSTGPWYSRFGEFPMIGLRGILGDKKNSFAVSVNLGIWSSIGLYYKNLYINYAYYPWVITTMGDWFFVDIGYAFSF